MTPLRRCHFVPPYLLQELVRTGTLDPSYVDECLRLDTTFRDRRETPSPPPAQPAPTVSRWTVHDTGNTETLPGRPVRRESEPETGDPATDEAAAGITSTLDLFRDNYARESFDGEGAPVLLTVHYGRNYANAFWDGTHLVFGDGDGRIFQRFTRAVDVLGHEFTHAVTEHTAALVYRDQAGALNESISDVFASCVKQQVLGQQVDDADWLIGEGIFAPGINARGLRDMAEPGTAYDDPRLGKDPQPSHMDEFVRTTDDNGGVHINSGIPNRAFVLAARAIGGTAADGAGRIWYDALVSGDVAGDADFASFVAVTIAVAGDHADVVREAWEQVGVQGATTTQAPPPRVPGAVGEGQVVVRRSGGFAGQVLEGSVDLGAGDDVAAEVCDLLERLDLAAVGGGTPQPDRYVYVVRVGDAPPVEVPEQDLTDDLRRLVGLVLGDA